MMLVGWTLVLASVAVVLYAYVLYPAILGMLASIRGRSVTLSFRGDWPRVSITIPVYNEVAQIDELLESVLRIVYPRDRLQILVVSDASDDGTDERVAAYAARGIELLRMPVRGGKSAAENAARAHLRGDIIVNTDASIRIAPDALEPLIARFADPSVGLASGRDVSVTRVTDELNSGESAYVGYEMWVRSIETEVTGIVGASGCFYAIRRELHEHDLPPGLSRDFAAALVTRERGYRAVSVNEAICLVPRTPALQQEYRRKVRTIARGMQTLAFKRSLLNPLRYGLFAWMLFSHKIARWAAPWAAVAGFAGLLLLAPAQPVAIVAVVMTLVVLAAAFIGWRWPASRQMPRALSMPAYLVAGNVAVLAATLKALRGESHAVWEPTRRDHETGKPVSAAA